MKIATRAWNAFVDRIFAAWIQSITRLEGEDWRHPWHCQLNWSALQQSWVVSIKPGLCLSGGHSLDTSVTVRVPLRFAPDATLARLGLRRSADPSPVEAYLTEEPEIPIPSRLWRPVGTDAAEASGFPLSFRKLGVNPATVTNTAISGDGSIQSSQILSSDGQPIHDRPRLLRACSLVLYHDRLSNRTDWSYGAGVDATVAQFSATVASRPDRQARPYLRLGVKYEPEAEPDPLVRLRGGWEDGGVDTKLVATLYLLSQPGLASGSRPDQMPSLWTGHADHDLFWHVGYRTTDFGSPPAPSPLQMPGLSLAGGILASFAPALADINDRYAALSQYLDARLIRGQFFTL